MANGLHRAGLSVLGTAVAGTGAGSFIVVVRPRVLCGGDPGWVVEESICRTSGIKTPNSNCFWRIKPNNHSFLRHIAIGVFLGSLKPKVLFMAYFVIISPKHLDI